jgi:hypothetical protein
MYLNTVANSVMVQLYLQHDFYNLIFQITRKLYIASGSAFPTSSAPVCACLVKGAKFCHTVKVYLYIVLLPALTKLELHGPILVKFPEIKFEIKRSSAFRDVPYGHGEANSSF